MKKNRKNPEKNGAVNNVSPPGIGIFRQIPGYSPDPK
jgi:hypothetical protein